MACNSPAPDNARFSDPQAAGPALISAQFTLTDAAPEAEGASARIAAESLAADFTLSLYDSAERGALVWTSTQEGLPLSAVVLQIPVDVQGTFFYSAMVEVEDGRTYLSADQLVGTDGEPVFPEAADQTLSLRFDEHTELHLELYEQLSADGEVGFNSDLSVEMLLTDEQKAMVGALTEVEGHATVTGCVAWGGSALATAGYDEDGGRFAWESLTDAVLRVGATCTLDVTIKDHGAPRLKGQVTFEVPAAGGVLPVQMDLEVVDAYIDAFFDVEGMLANVTFSMDDGLVAWLEQGDWSGELAYSLTADNGSDAPLVTAMDRRESQLTGSLFPLNPDVPVYALTLTIWDGGTVILQGSDVVDFSASDNIHLTLSYELGIEITTTNLTNVYFHGWLDDDAEQISGIHVDAAVTSAQGEVSQEACDTGTSGNYTCMLRLPLGVSVEATFGYPGYLSQTLEPFEVDSLTSISLPYVRLLPEGCEGGMPGDPEVCDGLDNDCDGLADEGLDFTFYADADGDGFGDPASATLACAQPEGYGTSAGDCDDLAASINPDAEEVCDGLDNDCDGEVDPGLTSTFYADGDGDGFGDGESAVDACEAPAGHVGAAGDCDDTSAAASPDGSESCNGQDDDCDGQIDEAVTSDYYADADADGYGDGLSSLSACSQPDGYVSSSDDCDDADPAVNAASTESCNGQDDDCDGGVDEGVAGLFYMDADGDGHGSGSLPLFACIQGLGMVDLGDDCDDSNPAISPSATEVCNGIDDDCDGHEDEGTKLTAYVDADGDGHGDGAQSTQVCEIPEGSSALGDDCDDADPAVSPSAIEVCNGIDDDCDGGQDENTKTIFYADDDGDGHGDPLDTAKACNLPAGHVEVGDDCDDTDATVYPGATEVCNGVDEDCDGAKDEGTKITFYADDDGDTFGDPETTQSKCQAPAGYVDVDGDCDDANAATNPAASEVCDEEDNDCDGATDEGVTTDYLADADGDGYGDEASVLAACELPAGYTLTPGDCDDAHATAHPGGVEVCDDDNVDEDCDGLADDEDAEGAAGLLTWYADADEDSFGDAGTAVEGCDDPSAEGDAWSEDDSDCDDTNAEVNPLATEICGDGLDNNCDTKGCLYGQIDLEDSNARIIGENSPDRAGQDLAYGDFNGDGYDDLLIPSYRHNQAGSNAGAVYVIYGPNISGDIDLANADAELLAEGPGDNAGWAVANAGDVNGDGKDDILIGAPYADANGVDAGAAYLVYGPVSGTSSLSNAAARIIGQAVGDRAGWSVAGAGDVNGDGYADVLVGATYNDAGGENAGAAYLLLGPLSGNINLSTADATLRGDNAWDLMGFTVAPGGDINGDGHGDFLVGANNDDQGGLNAGAAYVVYGPVSGVVDLSSVVKLVGAEAGDYAGRSLAGGGDIDGDGLDDILVGAFFDSAGGNATSAAYVLYGPVDASMTLDAADATITGNPSFSMNKVDVAFAGDVDGDGLEDILLGFHHESNGDFYGSAYLFTQALEGVVGVAQADTRLVGTNVRDYAGCAVSSAGDVDGDGNADFMVGAWGYDAGGTDAGAAYLLKGGL